MLKVAITGGIGGGKSTVCSLFAELGVAIYDSDKQAKRLMNSDAPLIAKIESLFGKEAYAGGELDRGYVASKVFVDRELLERLNSLVHPAVRSDFDRWAGEKQQRGASYVIMESALLFEGDLYQLFDVTVTVSAPVELRIERTVVRDGAGRERVLERVRRQMDDAAREAMADYVIHNADGDLLLPQVLNLHEIFKSYKIKEINHGRQKEQDH